MELRRNRVRIHARLPLKLPIRVACRESADCEWTEKSRLIDVNQFGAGFTLTRPVEVGRFIQLTIPLPYQLRCFDQFEPSYSVWSLVRHVALITLQPATFRVGAAFVGKRPPAGYGEDPTCKFEPLPMKIGLSSMWRVTKCLPAPQRRELRLSIPIEVIVETLDENGRPFTCEHTVTETISSLGMCILTNLELSIGRILKITSVADGISIFAAIRSREVKSDGITRLGLEFVADRWPLGRESRFTHQDHPGPAALGRDCVTTTANHARSDTAQTTSEAAQVRLGL